MQESVNFTLVVKGRGQTAKVLNLALQQFCQNLLQRGTNI